MRTLLVLLLALPIGGCMVTDRETLFYTRAEIDAITALSECKALARNLVQIARCETRR